MTEPKFQIGETVAVCGHRIERGSDEWLVVPKTTVSCVALYQAGSDYITRSGAICHTKKYSGFLYEIDGYPDIAVREPSIRPYREDDYAEPSTQEKEVSA